MSTHPRFYAHAILQAEYPDCVTKSANALLALTNNVLDLATIDAGDMKLELGPVTGDK